MEKPDTINFVVTRDEKGKEWIRHANSEGLIYLTGNEVSIQVMQVVPPDEWPEFINE